ncbi:hypothetical protein [uncultured Flavobacterium sp.]|uniref:hypothetical protein n=1 Tax=uncultured Flavobacterium sp. TaxID=165435 RepID=UPI0030ED54B3|tara:strand:+ start:103 stop:327 length:225 start_codon:yes stop_codon:yes gene_type:complete
MKNLEVRTRIRNNAPIYKKNLFDAILFLRHEEDKIRVISGKTVNIEVYDNGKPIFLGDKQELFEILKANNLRKN